MSSLIETVSGNLNHKYKMLESAGFLGVTFMMILPDMGLTANDLMSSSVVMIAYIWK